MTAPEPGTAVLQAVAVASLAGVRTRLELVLTPAEGGAVAGIVSVACCPGMALASFLLYADEIEFFDAPCRKTDRALVRTFGMPAGAVREAFCDLATQVVRDMVRDPDPTPATVH